MKKLISVLLILALPALAFGWTMPVPSGGGGTAGENVYMSDANSITSNGALKTNCTATGTWDNSTTVSVSGVSCYVVSPTDNITITGISETGAVAGQFLIIVNAGAVNSITINESAGVNNQAGNITLGPLDTITYIYSGSSWFQIGQANN